MTDTHAPLTLEEFAPRPMVVLDTTEVPRPKFPVIDGHNHLGGGVFGKSAHFKRWDTAELIALMDEVGVEMILDLDGGFGERLDSELAHYQEPHPGKFIVFAGLDYTSLHTGNAFGETEAKRLRESVAKGARGLKVWKNLGLNERDDQGRLIPIDDERLDPIWATCAELNLPVLIHIADPVAFFEPIDRYNERAEQLLRRPDWHFHPVRETKGDTMSPHFASFDELMDQFESLMTRHRDTVFIGAHVGCYAENLKWVGRVMDACPNFHVDISARIAELGRQPYSTRDFMIRYQDRVLFGTDATPNTDVYRTHYRFLETRDEYFDYGQGETPTTGRWQIYGLDLPDDVLRKIYADNTRRIVLRETPGGAG